LKIRLLLTTLVIVLLTISGCGGDGKKAADSATDVKAPPAASGQPHTNTKTITAIDQFTPQYKNWTSRMEEIAAAANTAYGEWTSGKANKEQFLTKIKDLKGQMQKLNEETDLLTEFNYTPEEKAKINYDAIAKEYARASKNLNDFLVIASRLEDDAAVKDKFNSYITENYAKHLEALKNILK
jgi:hypothetical protein